MLSLIFQNPAGLPRSVGRSGAIQEHYLQLEGLANFLVTRSLVHSLAVLAPNPLNPHALDCCVFHGMVEKGPVISAMLKSG